MKSVDQIRKRIRAERRAVDPQIRELKNSEICQRFSEMDSYQSAKHVAAYLAFDGEADPMELMVSAVDQGKRVYLPLIIGKSKPLAFAPWTPTTTMVKNRFDILEPDVEKSKWIAATELDFVICPLVGFDEQKNRIGVGGGFYDRTFEFLTEPEQSKSVQLIGFAFELQKLPSIQPQAWDVGLTAVITESQIYR